MSYGLATNGRWRHLGPYSLEMRGGVPYFLISPKIHPRLGNLYHLGYSIGEDGRHQFVATCLEDRLAFLRGGEDGSIEVRPFHSRVMNEERTRLRKDTWNKIAPESQLTFGAFVFGVGFDRRRDWEAEECCLQASLKWGEDTFPVTLEPGGRLLLGSSPEKKKAEDHLLVLKGREVRPLHLILSWHRGEGLQLYRADPEAEVWFDGSILEAGSRVITERGTHFLRLGREELLWSGEAGQEVGREGGSAKREEEPLAFVSRETVVQMAVDDAGERGVRQLHRDFRDGEEEALLLGRSFKGNETVPGVYTFQKDTVSRVHGLVSLSEEGCWYEDLASLNGSFLGDRPVYKHRLRWGEVLVLGGARVVFQKQISSSAFRRVHVEGEWEERASTSSVIALRGFLDVLRSDERREENTFVRHNPFGDNES